MGQSKMLQKIMKNVVIGMSVLAIGLAGTGCAKQAEAPAKAAADSAAAPVTAGKLAEIQEKGKIVLGTSADYPPYEFHKTIDGKDTIVGFDIEIAKAVAESLGVELEIVDMKFEGLLPALTGNKIDFIVAGMNPTEERKKSVDFSVEYYEAHQTILVMADQAPNLSTEESFKGKIIGVQKGTLQEQIATEKFTDSEIKGIGKIPDLIMELKTGKIDGIILADTVAKSYVATNADLATNGMDLGSEGGVAIAMAKGSPELIEAVNAKLEALMAEGKVEQWITDANLMVETE